MSAWIAAFAAPFAGVKHERSKSGNDAAARPRRLALPRPLRLLALCLWIAGMFLTVISAAWAQGVVPASAADTGVWGRVAHFVVEQPWATIVLLVLGCLLLFHDLLTPFTWGVTGTLGVIFVGTVFAAHLTVGSGGWIGIILLLGGVTFLLLETHVFPGHGIAAVAGLLLLFLGMFWSLGGSQNALFALSVSSVLTIVSLIAFFAYLPKSPIWKQLGQQMRQNAALGYVTSDNQMFLLGRSGRSLTVLRPSGMAEIDGMRVDVVTEGDFLEAGTPIVVTEVAGSRVVVSPVSSVEQIQPAVTSHVA